LSEVVERDWIPILVRGRVFDEFRGVLADAHERKLSLLVGELLQPVDNSYS
jgi:hypothetical protein